MPLTIVWFRRDLRLSDNAALSHAIARGQVLPVYIYVPEEETPWQPGAASRWWLHHSLKSLARDIEKLGSRLIIRRGPTVAALRQLVTETGADAIVWNRLYEPATRRQENNISNQLQAGGIHCHSFNGHLLFEPGTITNQSGSPYRIFTPFWNTCLKRGLPQSTLDSPNTLALAAAPSTLDIEDLKLLPEKGWDAAFYFHWQPGEAGAQKRLAEFCHTTLEHYPEQRDFPARDGTSRLSPHLHFGELSPRQILATTEQIQLQDNRSGIMYASESFIRELGWREFAHHILYYFPATSYSPLDSRFNQFPWDDDPGRLQQWQQGMTGFPIIDAGMRELWQTGTMHNRVRMIVASFLTKNGGLHWLTGARWFWDTLVDADLASNSLNWQWVAGCGADAAPYFRIFNPTTQGQKFDPDGVYIRRWIPELSAVANDTIHTPGKIRINNYPSPILDLSSTRQRALMKYHTLIRNPARPVATMR